jgi:hypothetical protein
MDLDANIAHDMVGVETALVHNEVGDPAYHFQKRVVLADMVGIVDRADIAAAAFDNGTVDHLPFGCFPRVGRVARMVEAYVCVLSAYLIERKALGTAGVEMVNLFRRIHRYGYNHRELLTFIWTIASSILVSLGRGFCLKAFKKRRHRCPRRYKNVGNVVFEVCSGREWFLHHCFYKWLVPDEAGSLSDIGNLCGLLHRGFLPKETQC